MSYTASVPQKVDLTRMHSSRMHTTRLLTVSRSIQEVGYLPGGVVCRGCVSASGPGGCLPLVPGDVCLWSQGMSASGPGGCLSRGVSAQECVSASGPGGVYLWFCVILGNKCLRVLSKGAALHKAVGC